MRNRYWLNVSAHTKQAHRKAKRWAFVGRQIGPGRPSQVIQGSHQAGRVGRNKSSQPRRLRCEAVGRASWVDRATPQPVARARPIEPTSATEISTGRACWAGRISPSQPGGLIEPTRTSRVCWADQANQNKLSRLGPELAKPGGLIELPRARLG